MEIFQNIDDLTQRLKSWRAGDIEVRDQLFQEIERDLNRLAARIFSGERAGHTLSPTALVNELYLRVDKIEVIEWKDRVHFRKSISTMMRRILVDHARKKLAEKRGGDLVPVPLDGLPMPSNSIEDFIDLDRNIEKLKAEKHRCAEVLVMKYFGGMKLAEIGEVLDIKKPTVKKDLEFARAFVYSRSRVDG